MSTLIIGGIYLVDDSKVILLPAERREIHEERRRFLVLSGPETNSDPRWPVLLGCPLSGSTRFRTRFDVKLAYGEAGVTKKSWIRVPAIQPILKTDIQDLTGTLAATRLAEVQARLLEYMALIGAASTVGDDLP